MRTSQATCPTSLNAREARFADDLEGIGHTLLQCFNFTLLRLGNWPSRECFSRVYAAVRGRSVCPDKRAHAFGQTEQRLRIARLITLNLKTLPGIGGRDRSVHRASGITEGLFVKMIKIPKWPLQLCFCLRPE